MNNKFINYLKEQLGSIYVWGGQGQVATEALIDKLENSDTNKKRALVLLKKRKSEGKKDIKAYDCSGLIIKYMLDNRLRTDDTTAQGLCNESDPIKRAELQASDLVFRHNGTKIHHVGIYIGDNKVIHSKGRDVGVVTEDINANGSTYWNRYGRHPKLMIHLEQKAQPKICLVDLPMLKQGDKNKAVETVQSVLSVQGYDLGKIDGNFGSNTDNAVKAYQKDNKLTSDGVVGEKTWSRLLKGE